jgi:hypothetical protein
MKTVFQKANDLHIEKRQIAIETDPEEHVAHNFPPQFAANGE